jgi:hypothetical protein
MDEPEQGVEEQETVQEEIPDPHEEGNEVEQGEESDQLPQEPDKQREAFIKQRQIIAEQKRQLEELQSQRQDVLEEQSVLDNLRGLNKQEELSPHVTPDSDLDQVINNVNYASQRSSEASKRITDLEQRLEDERLYREVPELNPENPDNKKPEVQAFEKYLAGQYLLEATKLFPKGKKPDMVSLAKKAKDDFSSLTLGQKEQIASEAVQQLQKTEQASLEARGSSVAQPKKVNLDDLRDRARRGDHDALQEVLKNTVLSD